MWTWSSKVFVNHSNLLVWQRINHYPRIKELTRKDLLKLHLESCQRLYGTHFEVLSLEISLICEDVFLPVSPKCIAT